MDGQTDKDGWMEPRKMDEKLRRKDEKTTTPKKNRKKKKKRKDKDGSETKKGGSETEEDSQWGTHIQKKKNRCDPEVEDHVPLCVIKTTRVPSVLVKGSANRLSFLTTHNTYLNISIISPPLYQ